MGRGAFCKLPNCQQCDTCLDSTVHGCQPGMHESRSLGNSLRLVHNGHTHTGNSGFGGGQRDAARRSRLQVGIVGNLGTLWHVWRPLGGLGMFVESLGQRLDIFGTVFGGPVRPGKPLDNTWQALGYPKSRNTTFGPLLKPRLRKIQGFLWKVSGGPWKSLDALGRSWKPLEGLGMVFGKPWEILEEIWKPMGGRRKSRGACSKLWTAPRSP